MWSQEEVHTVTMELRDREMKASTLHKKYELLVDKMRQEMGDDGERKSPAYYVVLRAQVPSLSLSLSLSLCACMYVFC